MDISEKTAKEIYEKLKDKLEHYSEMAVNSADGLYYVEITYNGMLYSTELSILVSTAKEYKASCYIDNDANILTATIH
ncbi:MAG: hypothetical protein GWN31_07520 [Candidatus Thorarchaeota archaeon]|nr:hypothetical protein [Candidatus Thorarchaeota archaeon]NIW13766.1 hypothetical protein [Candidatus Thorarchaeota archaeon]NIW51863.1 hypothetical protein [Candidatus Korarchaeota archaeon]